MAVQLVNLRNVPEDEADELRRLLAEHHVDFYETPGGNWGISIPALWLKDRDDLARARALVDAYQAERAAQARREYLELAARGEHRTLFDELRQRPGRFILYTAVIGLVLYLSTKPFLSIGG